MNTLKKMRNVAIIIACLAATTMISGCSKDTNNSGDNPDNPNHPTGRVIRAAELISVEDAERILGETIKDSSIDKRRDCEDYLVYWLSHHTTGVYLYQEALYDKNDWKSYLQEMEIVYINVGEKMDINNANAYYTESVFDGMARLQIFDSGYRISLNVMRGGETSEEQMLYKRGKVIEIGTLALERLREIVKN